MANRAAAATIDEYIAGFPAETQKVLEELRALIKAIAPDATETISYAIPTFDLNGRHLVHFAGFAKHIGFYPMPSGMEAFKEELKPYKQREGLGAVPPWPASAQGPDPPDRRVQGSGEYGPTVDLARSAATTDSLDAPRPASSNLQGAA